MSIRNKASRGVRADEPAGRRRLRLHQGQHGERAPRRRRRRPRRGGAAAGGEIKEGLKIAFLPKQINNPYFTISDKGGEDAVNARQGRVQARRPVGHGRVVAGVSYINTLTTQKQDAIVISANDANAVVPALEKAQGAPGIKVVTYDSDTDPEGRDLFINQAAAEDLGRSQVQLLAKQIGPEGGEIAILSATPNATNQNTWIEFMKDELKKPEYSKFKLVKTAYGNDDDQKSFEETQGLLQAYPDLKGIISPTTVGIAAAARYLQGSDVQGQGQADRSRHAEPAARLRQGRHDRGLRAVGSGQARLPRRLRRGRARLGHDHRRRGREVRRRRPRRADRRRQGRDPPRPADRLRQGQHRRLRLLVVVARASVMERVCFQVRVRADRLDEYRERHRAVWPEMLAALSATGWTQLLAVPAPGRPADRLPRDRRFRGRQAGDGGDRRERTLAGRDGAAVRARARLRAAGGGVPP